MAKVGVVYASGSKQVRRIVVPDDDAELDRLPLHARETLLTAEKADYDLLGADGLIERETGIKPADPRHAVVHPSGHVIAVIHADPDIDDIPGHALIKAEGHHIVPGHRWTKQRGFYDPGSET